MSNFSQESVLQATRESLRDIGPTLFPLIALLGLPNLIYNILQPMYPTNIAISYGLYVLGAVAALLGGLVAMNATRQAKQGLSMEPAALMKRPVALWGHSIGLSLLLGVGVMLATFAFIVPGIILMMAWFVAAPVLLFEGRGVRASLQRSQQLTTGHRGQIFGMVLHTVLIVLAMFMIPSMALAIGWNIWSGDFESPIWSILTGVALYPIGVLAGIYLNALTVHTYDALCATEHHGM